jgi:hypothetical protein
MDKSYGPKGFEKAWIKALKDFNETKIIFKRSGSQTILQYIDGNKLIGVEMYRNQFEIDKWLGHFQHYLDTGKFDTNAYWVEYTSINKNGEIISTDKLDIYSAPMKLVNKLWNVHSKEFSKFIDSERKLKGDLGFKQVSRP